MAKDGVPFLGYDVQDGRAGLGFFCNCINTPSATGRSLNDQVRK